MDKIPLATLAQIEGHCAATGAAPDRLYPQIRALATELRNSLLQLVGHMPTRFLRVALYRTFGMKISAGVAIAPGCSVLGGPGRITIGTGTVINRGVILDGRFPLTIGENVSISIQSTILTLEHDLTAPDFRAVGAPVVIGDRAFLGARVMVLPGVTIGEGAAAAAGAVVTRDVEPYAIVAGIPAKAIASRPRHLTYRF